MIVRRRPIAVNAVSFAVHRTERLVRDPDIAVFSGRLRLLATRKHAVLSRVS
jgi:hypothetical protein